MAKITWSTRLEESQKTEIENRISELMKSNPDGERGTLLLEGLKALTEERFAEQSSYGDTLKNGYAAIEQVKNIMQGIVSAADAAEAAAAEKYLERIKNLEELAGKNKAEADKAKQEALQAQETAHTALETQKASESALNDKTALTIELRGQIEALKEQAKEDAEKLAGANEKLVVVQDTLEALRLELNEAEKSLSAADKENAKLEKANAILTTEKIAAQESKQELKERVAETRGDLEKANAKVEKLEADLAAAQAKLIDYQILANEKADEKLKELKGK